MGSRLQQVLRGLCLNTGWKYAVFWKLTHRTRIMFTWEDAYYDGNQYAEKRLFNPATGSLIEGPYSHDPLGLAVAKMSYEVYSLGEGVVGQVAVSGKHSWIFSDEHIVDSSSSEGGWQTQFSAGIKTIAVVAFIPHGVVQLGSLHKIAEDLKLVDHIRNVFSELQDSSAARIPSLIKSNAENSCLSDASTKISDSAVNDPVAKLKGSLHEDEANMWSQLFSPLGESVNQSLIFPPGNKISLPSSSDNINIGTDSSQLVSGISPFSFCAGFELYEALGPSFQSQNNNPVWEAGKTNPDTAVDISEGIGSCSLLMDNNNNNNSDMHLLDAVVAKIGSRKGDDTESESLLTAEKTPCNSIGTISSSRGSEHLERARGPVKMNKKRARPGESSRPRPRDRQLIQDRIKELRELVPNGSKCSIDSLLERTIKHMMFLQSVTKHAEKLHKCSASKLLDKDTGIQRFSSREQGSSWAVEVGNNQKICPIIVENINMNGQMLVEMLSKECGQFLEIAETIRSLGLTILKGVSEAYGNQTWMCFVVENNRSMHRMDVLWSLMQLLQPKLS
ncbi:transcription factor emb1444 [Phtheirospermum japonicum]|uniref:Transcription factor emb1444 n=1 Tax=Phtheirospermum japonicum TaxID=374723 RepID=A0A830CKQ1_9LAMI|nr:transcription factor emb1444 [Phtheirospermum japonicum]